MSRLHFHLMKTPITPPWRQKQWSNHKAVHFQCAMLKNHTQKVYTEQNNIYVHKKLYIWHFLNRNLHDTKQKQISPCRTHSPAELTEILPRLFCNVAQAEVWTVGLFVLMIMTLVEVFLHVTLVWCIFDVSPAGHKNTSSSESLQLFLCPTYDLSCMCVWACVCVEVLYLRTLNLGKWIEFLMNTVKLMASTNVGSLWRT